MIRIKYSIKLYPKTYNTNCPYCCSDVSFYNLSPVFCNKCQEELPNFSKILENVEDRIDYLETGLQYSIGN